MFLFTGVVDSLQAPTGDPETGEPGWAGQPSIEIKELIYLIESFRPFTPQMHDYHKTQLSILSSLLI